MIEVEVLTNILKYNDPTKSGLIVKIQVQYNAALKGLSIIILNYFKIISSQF